MSTRELKRAGVLARVVAATLTLGSAATLMGVSYRQAKRLCTMKRSVGGCWPTGCGVGCANEARIAGGANARRISASWSRWMVVFIDGLKIAKRGHPGTPQARTWVALEPGWRVLDGPDGAISVEYDAPKVQ